MDGSGTSCALEVEACWLVRPGGVRGSGFVGRLEDDDADDDPMRMPRNHLSSRVRESSSCLLDEVIAVRVEPSAQLL